jgi:hypothetical protein
MKKNLKLSIIITGILNVSCALINYICARFFEFLPIGFHMSGGEYDGYSGFGILLEKIYPMTAYPGESEASLHISFSITSFLIFFVLTFILIFAIISIIKLLRGNKNG